MVTRQGRGNGQHGSQQCEVVRAGRCKEFCDEYTRHLNKLRSNANATRISYQKELDAMPAKVRGIIDVISARGAKVVHLADELDELKAREDELKELLNEAPELPPMVHPSMAKLYQDRIMNLREAINAEHTRQEAAEILRTLIDRIVLTPSGPDNGLEIDLQGDLAGILSLANHGDREQPDTDRKPQIRKEKLRPPVRRN